MKMSKYKPLYLLFRFVWQISAIQTQHVDGSMKTSKTTFHVVAGNIHLNTNLTESPLPQFD
jgi:hypothetical protein